MKSIPDKKQIPFFLLRSGVLIVLVTLGGCFMMSMPGKSHTGSLPPLTVEGRRLAEHLKADVTMLALETIGYYSDAPKSQQYPPPFSLLFPDTGNFIGFVGNLKSRSLVRTSIKTFRETTPFPSEGLAAPEFIKGVGWSDQWSFWQEGYPGIMVTDTAPFRYPHYHETSDTPDKLDYERMARVVTGVGRVVEGLVK